MDNKNTSRFWKRFRKNKAAMASMFFIMSVILMAVFAYPLSPDDTTDANTMMVEIGTREPGFSCFFLKRYTSVSQQKTSLLNYLIHGKQRHAELIPIQNFRFENDSIHVRHILDENSSESLSFSLKQLSPETASYDKREETFILHRTFWLGTDRYGRDVLSRLLIGSRVSMAVGFIAVLISIVIGVWFGAMSGYFGVWN